MNKYKKQRIAAFLASMAITSFGVVGAADTSNVATENATYIDITINNIKEDSGLELGNNARARGNGSIATGTNSLAIGKNAVATGGNETKDTINNKLNENKQRLQEIQAAQDTADRLMKELDSIRKKEADVIEAGERVKQVRQAKEKAKQVWQDKLAAYNKAVQDSSSQLKDAQSKIADLNSRLTGVSKISGVNISSDEGLTHAATQLKAIAEEGTTLNLTVDFYKDYVRSYYKALGDLRQAENDVSNLTSQESTTWQYWKDRGQAPSEANGFEYLYYSGSSRLHGDSSIETIPTLKNRDNYKGTTGYYLYYPINLNSDGQLEFSFPDGRKIISINTDINIIDEKTYQEWQTNKASLKEAYINEILKLSNGKFKIADDSAFSAWTRETESLRMEYIDKKYDISYYQGMYEKTKDSTWLDKKKKAIDEANAIQVEFDARTYTDQGKGISVTLRGSGLYGTYFDDLNAYFKRTEITSIKERNKITTDTLTSELEKALGINKNAIQDIESNLAKLKTASDQAKSTYDNTNPSAADIALSQRYDEVMRDLLNKSNSLKAQQERLEALRKALTLHDLANVGENAMAIGTDALSTGTNSIAIGTNTIAASENAIAIGKGSAVTGTDSIAIGTGHIVIGNNAGTFGDPNTIYGDNSYAIGNNNTIGSSATPHTVSTNTFVLGNNVTTTANNAVILGAGSVGKDNTVSVGKPGAERQIINVAAGTLSSTSTDAVNGSQLYATNLSISNLENAIKNSSSKDMLAVHYDKDGPSITLGKQVERPYIIVRTEASNVVSDKVGPSSPSDKVVVDDPSRLSESEKEAVNGFMMLAAIPSGTNRDDDGVYKVYLDDDGYVMNPPHLADGTVPAWAKEKYDIPRSWNEDGSFDGRELEDKILEEKIGNLTSADTTLYITDPTPIKITNLADGAINENSSDAINGSQLYTALAGKADKDASNITGVDKTKWQETLGDGKAEAGNKGLISGDTLNTELNKKADKTDITNINADLANKANKDASNITGTDKTKWQETLGDGKAESGNKGLINGDTLNTELNKKADKTDITNINADLANKANKDASNISIDDAKKWAEKLGTGTITKGDTSLVTGDTVYNTTINKANTDMDNLTDTGKTVIQNLAKGSVKVIAGTNTTVTTSKDGNATTYAVNVSKDDIKAAVQADLNNKADRNAGNLTMEDKAAWKAALGDGVISQGNTGLVTGGTVYNVVKNIQLSADKLVTTDGATTFIDKDGTSTAIDVSHITKVMAS